ncbi:MAG: EamA family transporter [Clostridia bacterium]|nr:EamA family transporter [Clostridia bacterium]
MVSSGTAKATLYSFSVAFLLLCFTVKPRQIKTLAKNDRKSILLRATGSAISLAVISFTMTKLAGSVPSIILFPLFNGSGIIIVYLMSVFVFKEKPTKKKVFGLISGLLGLFLINF